MNSEFFFSEENIAYAKKSFDILLFEHTFLAEGKEDFLGAITHYLRKKIKVLIVVSITSIDVILPIIQRGNAICTLINTSCGILGFSNKGYWDMRDIAKAKDFGLNVYEPLYQEQISNFFNEKESCYIRINQNTCWKDQLPESIPQSNGILSFQDLGYAGNQATLICFGSLLIQSLYCASYLQEQSYGIDVFSSANVFFSISDEFKKSLKKTEKLFIVIDQNLGSFYEYWIQSVLYQSGFDKISVIFITPYYKNITSISLEYMYEQAQVDIMGIAQRIISR